MNYKNELKSYVALAGVSMKDVAKKLGISPAALSAQINRESLKYSRVLDIADILGYEIKWVKKEKNDGTENHK